VAELVIKGGCRKGSFLHFETNSSHPRSQKTLSPASSCIKPLIQPYFVHQVFRVSLTVKPQHLFSPHFLKK